MYILEKKINIDNLNFHLSKRQGKLNSEKSQRRKKYKRDEGEIMKIENRKLIQKKKKSRKVKAGSFKDQ